MTFEKIDNKVIIPWSYSALEAFELCPKKFYEEKISKRFKAPQGDFGIDNHKAFENYILKGTPLSLDLAHHKPFLDKIKGMPGEHLPEQKLAINKQFKPTGFFDADVYCRAIVDFAAVDTEKKIMVIADWKFGKQKEGFDQLKLMIAVMSCYDTGVEEYLGLYYWAKTKKITSIKINKTDIPRLWVDILPRVEALEDAMLSSEFPAIKNFLCGKYCPVNTCVHQGGSLDVHN